MKTLLFSLILLSSSTFAFSSTAWFQMNNDQKLERLQDYGDSTFSLDLDKEIVTYVVSSWRNRQFVVEAATKKYLKKIQSAKTDISLDIEDHHYAQVGNLQKSAEVLLSSDGKFLGAAIHYFQQGCSFEYEED